MFINFKSDIKASSLVSDFQHLDLDSLVTEYDRVLRAILDKHAPFIKTVKTVKYREPWYNKDIQKARRISRKYERTFRNTPTIEKKPCFNYIAMPTKQNLRNVKLSFCVT